MGAGVECLEEVRRRRLLLDRLDAWLFEEIGPYVGDRVLEVGCGHGNLVRHLVDRELVIATDKDPKSVALVQEQFGHLSNVQAHAYDIVDSPPDFLRSCALDTVISLNVLEHVEQDVAALSHMTQLLRFGGRVVLIVPAHQWLYGSMDASIGHYRRYDKRAMAEKLQGAGLQVENQFYFNALGTLGWFVNGRLLRQRVPPAQQLRWFNWIVPVVRWMERQVHPPFGLSLLSVARVGDKLTISAEG